MLVLPRVLGSFSLHYLIYYPQLHPVWWLKMPSIFRRVSKVYTHQTSYWPSVSSMQLKSMVEGIKRSSCVSQFELFKGSSWWRLRHLQVRKWEGHAPHLMLQSRSDMHHMNNHITARRLGNTGAPMEIQWARDTLPQQSRGDILLIRKIIFLYQGLYCIYRHT